MANLEIRHIVRLVVGNKPVRLAFHEALPPVQPGPCMKRGTSLFMPSIPRYAAATHGTLLPEVWTEQAPSPLADYIDEQRDVRSLELPGCVL